MATAGVCRDLIDSTSYKCNANYDASVAAHVRRSPRTPALEDVASRDSPWMTIRWLADGFLSQRAVIATLP
jgi:hypothetical protein